MTDPSALAGARLQRVDGPRPDLLALTFHRADLHGTLVLSTRPGAVDWGWVPERPRGDPANAFVGLLRKHLTNARLLDASVDAAGATLRFARGDSAARLRLEVAPPNLILVVDGVVRGARRPGALAERGSAVGAPWTGEAAAPDGAALADTFEALAARGPALVEATLGAAAEARRRALAKAVRRRRAQLRRRLRAIEGDLERVDRVETLRRHASLLLAHLSTLPEDASEAVVTDWNADPPAPLTLAIDPSRTPREEAEHLFHRARKLERGGEIALERHARTEAELERLEAVAARLPEADEAELPALEAEASRLGARLQGPPGSRSTERRRPFRTFRGFTDRAILVGRSAADNDTLTLRHARPWDHWLHARGIPGSHVVVPLERDEACPPELLADAAHLAAHFSDARGEPRVEVQHVPRRYVRKPRGAAPGAVRVEREKVLLLQLQPGRLERLLASEEPP